MVPDPVCASCHGSFVEKMENPTDDPREFHRQGGHNVGGDDFPFGVESFMSVLQGMANHGASESRHTTEHRHNGGRVTRTVEIRSGSGPTRTIRVLNPGDENPDQPSLTEFLQRRPSEGPGGGIAGPLMARYLMALLGRDNLTDLFGRGDELQPGRMGDYVFNQEALDQILTQLMEQSNSSRPVPATEEITEKLPREVLEVGSATLEKDCAVCKEQFKLGTEDPDEQVVVTLPCKHPFHEPCILPWLSSSGTCPVCRHALVPQPEHHGPPPRNGNGNGNGTSNRPRSPSGGPGPGPGPGPSGAFFQSLFGSPPSGSADGSGSARRRAASDTPRNHIPGGWEEELD